MHRGRSLADVEVTSILGFLGDRGRQGAGAVERLGGEVAERLGRPNLVVGQDGWRRPATDWRQALEWSGPTLRLAAGQVGRALDSGSIPITVASRCAMAIGTIPAILERHPDAVVVWLDAHGDLNRPDSSPTGYLGGMALSAVSGEWDSGYGAGLSHQDAILLGVRDLDQPERQLITERQIAVFPQIESTTVLDALSASVDGRPYYVHLDVDCFDPADVSAEYQVPGGPSPLAVGRALGALSTGQVVGVEIAEFEPRKIGDVTAAADVIATCLRHLFDGEL